MDRLNNTMKNLSYLFEEGLEEDLKVELDLNRDLLNNEKLLKNFEKDFFDLTNFIRGYYIQFVLKN